MSATLRGAAVLIPLLLVGCVHHADDASRLGWARAGGADLPWSQRLSTVEPSCGDGPITVAVHGIFGAGTEWADSLPGLPEPVWFYRWNGDQPLTAVMAGLETGLETLQGCGQPVTAIGHSAGGILLSRVVADLPAPTAPFTVFTVASPLAGIGLKDPMDDPSLPLFAHMGERIDAYPAGVAGITVVHLRTSPKRDYFSKLRRTHDPIGLRAPGATVYDLPANLDHNTSLPWAVTHIFDGSWTQLPSVTLPERSPDAPTP